MIRQGRYVAQVVCGCLTGPRQTVARLPVGAGPRSDTWLCTHLLENGVPSASLRKIFVKPTGSSGQPRSSPPSHDETQMELIERLGWRIGLPFTSDPMEAALSCAAGEIAWLALCRAPGAVLVLNALSGEQLLHLQAAVHSREQVDELLAWRIPQQICANCAQAAAFAFVVDDLEPNEWESCVELKLPNADDILLEWLAPEIEHYAYVLAADSIGRALIARAPVIGMLTGTFRVDYRCERIEQFMPVAFTEALRLSAMYCWPG
jgi:hypothetical protein